MAGMLRADPSHRWGEARYAPQARAAWRPAVLRLGAIARRLRLLVRCRTTRGTHLAGWRM